MQAMQYAKSKLVSRLFEKVSEGNYNTIVRYRGTSQDTPQMTAKIVIDNWK